jgi:hypothetical protein
MKKIEKGKIEFNTKIKCKKAKINAKMVTRHSKYWCPGGMRKISLGMGGGYKTIVLE